MSQYFEGFEEFYFLLIVETSQYFKFNTNLDAGWLIVVFE